MKEIHTAQDAYDLGLIRDISEWAGEALMITGHIDITDPPFRWPKLATVCWYTRQSS
jgi:hypothetical protein